MIRAARTLSGVFRAAALAAAVVVAAAPGYQYQEELDALREAGQAVPKGLSLPSRYQVVADRLGHRTLSKAAASMVTNVYEQTFESAVNWTVVGGGWEFGTPSVVGPASAHLGTRCAGTVIAGNYAGGADYSLTSAPVALPSSDTLTLSFWEWYSTESGYDYITVDIDTTAAQSGTWINIVAARSGSAASWANRRVALTSFRGKTVRLRFRLTTDGSVQDAGWYIDDVVIESGTAAAAPGINATVTNVDASRAPVVAVTVRVTDSAGQTIPGLTPADFGLSQDAQGVPFQVTTVSTGGSGAISVALVIDRSGSMAGQRLTDAKNAAIQFVRNLGPLDRCAVVVFDSYTAVQILQPATSDTALLIAAIGTIAQQGMTALLDGIALGLDAIAAEANTKGVIVFTDGQENDSKPTTTQASVIADARSAGTPVYTIGIGSSVNETMLRAIADSSGGTYSYAPTAAGLGAIYDAIKGTVASQYVLYYTSPDTINNGDAHSISVSVTVGGQTATVTSSWSENNSAPAIALAPATQALVGVAQINGSALAIQAQVTDNGTVSVVRLFYRRADTTVHSYTQVTMSLSGGFYTGTIPAASVQEPGVDFYLTATDDQGVTSSYPAANAASQPLTIPVMPNYAPQFFHTAVTSAAANTPVVIRAKVTDNTNMVDTVKLYYRRGNQVLYTTVGMTRGVQDTFTATIPDSIVTSSGVDYYMIATDDFGVSALCGPVNGSFRITVAGTGGSGRAFLDVRHGWTSSSVRTGMELGIVTFLRDSLRFAVDTPATVSLAGYEWYIAGYTSSGFSAGEIGEIQRFVNGGGKCLILGDWGTFGGTLNSMLTASGWNLGMRLAGTSVNDAGHEVPGGNTGQFRVFNLNHTGGASELAGVDTLFVLATDSLVLGGPAVPLYWSSNGHTALAARSTHGTGVVYLVGDGSSLLANSDSTLPTFGAYDTKRFVRNLFGTAGARLYGDVSRNGQVTAYDASLVLRHAVGQVDSLIPLPLNAEAMALGDVSGNGSVTAFDASYILRYTAGLIASFPVQGGPVKAAAQTASAGSLGLEFDGTAIKLCLADLSQVYSAEIDIVLPEGIKVRGVTSSAFEAAFHQEGRIVTLAAARAALTGAASGEVARIELAGAPAGNIASWCSAPRVLVNDGTVRVTGLAFGAVKPIAPSLSVTVIGSRLQVGFALPQDGKVMVELLSLNGRRVALLNNSELRAGVHTVVWNSSQVGSGMYLLSLRAPGVSLVKRLPAFARQ